MTKQLSYYRRLRDILIGNTTGWAGVYDDADQASEAAKNLSRALYGVTVFAGGSTSSQVRGMTEDILNEIKDYIKALADPNDLDMREKAREFVEGIIAQENKKAVMYTVKKRLAIKNKKVSHTVFVEPIESPAIEESAKEKIKSFWKQAKELDKFKVFSDILTFVARYAGSAALMAGMQGAGILNRNSGGAGRITYGCVLGVLPIPHVREIEIARSGKVLKFRATGSVFLAKQEGGGDDAIRIECDLYRDELVWIIFLWTLYLYGRPTTDEIEGFGSAPVLDPLTLRKNAKNIMKINRERAKPSVENYKTFPFVSRHVIIPNVYIETLSFEERTDDGLDSIKVSILLRTFNKKEKFKVWNSDDPNIVYVQSQYDQQLKWHKMAEYGINVVWRLIQEHGFVINSGAWKSGVSARGIPGNPQTRDVYYNVTPLDIISTFGQGIMGFASLKLPITLGSLSVASSAVT